VSSAGINKSSEGFIRAPSVLTMRRGQFGCADGERPFGLSFMLAQIIFSRSSRLAAAVVFAALLTLLGWSSTFARGCASMKPMRASVCSLSCVLAASLCFSHLTIATAAAPAVKAFPTAEGFGADAVGGSGGQVIEVTRLDDSGPGSFRAAMVAPGPRIVVFRVSGTITLTNAIRVRTPYPFDGEGHRTAHDCARCHAHAN